jgi:hypothetical protein
MLFKAGIITSSNYFLAVRILSVVISPSIRKEFETRQREQRTKKAGESGAADGNQPPRLFYTRFNGMMMTKPLERITRFVFGSDCPAILLAQFRYTGINPYCGKALRTLYG